MIDHITEPEAKSDTSEINFYAVHLTHLEKNLLAHEYKESEGSVRQNRGLACICVVHLPDARELISPSFEKSVHAKCTTVRAEVSNT